MLQRVEIHNFKSCQDVVLDDLQPVTALVGRNASGKTNILRAIEWIAGAVSAKSILRPVFGSLGSCALRIALKEGVYSYSLNAHWLGSEEPGKSLFKAVESLSFVPTGNAVKRLIFRRQDETIQASELADPIQIGALTPAMPALLSLMPADSPLFSSLKPVVDFLKGVTYYRVSGGGHGDSSTLIIESEYEKWREQFEATADPGNSTTFQLLHLYKNDKHAFEEVVNLLGPNGLGLLDRIDAWWQSSIGKSPPLFVLSFAPSGLDIGSLFGLAFRDLSAGTQRIVRIIVSLFFDKSSVMLLEHPEDEIHRALQYKLIDILKGYSDRTQVILSSHSPIVLNSLAPEAIRLVTMEDGATKVRGLSHDELQVVGRYLEEEGSLADFLETVEEN